MKRKTTLQLLKLEHAGSLLTDKFAIPVFLAQIMDPQDPDHVKLLELIADHVEAAKRLDDFIDALIAQELKKDENA